MALRAPLIFFVLLLLLLEDLFNELCYFSLLTSQRRLENVVYETFPNKRFCYAVAKDICFNFRHKDVGKRDCHFSPHS